MKKVLVIVIPVVILLGISCFLGIYSYNETLKLDAYFDSDNKETALLDILDTQESINARLSQIANNRSYTIDNAYVELNPYEISPLSAIIIFQTSNAESINVYLNGEFFTTMESSISHVIPVYGLYEDFDNVVRLETASTTHEYTITTDKSNIEYPLEVIESNDPDNNDWYFTVASYATWLTAWDTEGNLRFYLTRDLRMDVEWLDNGHFIIGESNGQYAENFYGFVEMDYLGKIYNYYSMEHGFSFESQILSNGNYMSAGGRVPVYIDEQVIYEMDPTTGKTVSMLNIAEVIKGIDADFPDNYLGQSAIRNGFYYDEETDEVIVSFRGWNAILSFTYSEKKLNWIFTDSENELFQDEVWDQYLIKSVSGRTPLGIHSPQITSDGNIAFFNNGYDRYNGFEVGGEDSVLAYRDNYSSAEIYHIDTTTMTAELVWSYDDDKSLFSHQYGSFRVLSDNHKLIDFGYVLTDEYRNSSTGTLSEAEKNPDNIYAYIVELDENDEIVFSAICEEGKYRAFKHNVYMNTMSNVDLDVLNIFDSIEESEYRTDSYKNVNLESSREWINSLDFTKNTFITNYDIQESDEISLYFVNRTGRIYIFDYKDADSSTINRIFNLNLPSSEYALFINLNNVLYNTNTIIEY